MESDIKKAGKVHSENSTDSSACINQCRKQ